MKDFTVMAYALAVIALCAVAALGLHLWDRRRSEKFTGVLGVTDPKAHRQLAEVIRQAQRRGI